MEHTLTGRARRSLSVPPCPLVDPVEAAVLVGLDPGALDVAALARGVVGLLPAAGLVPHAASDSTDPAATKTPARKTAARR